MMRCKTLTITLRPIDTARRTAFASVDQVQELFTTPEDVDPQLEIKVANNDTKICPGITMIFTCETRGTDNQIWITNNSDLSDQITVNANERGMLRNSTIFDNINIHVVLEESFDKNGFRVMKSVFLVTVISQSTGYEDLSVTCQNVKLDTSSNTTIEVAGPDYCEAHVTTTHQFTAADYGSQACHLLSSIAIVILMPLVVIFL